MADLEELVLSISADTRQMQRALQKLQGDVKTAGDGIDNAFKAPKVDNVAKSLNKTRFETANLAAQFQDIAVQLQGGASPFTIALQQGTQINQVLGMQGAGGTLALLGNAFKSLLTPVSLATIGIIALGGYAVQYGAKAIGAVDDLDDKLKAHGELIQALKDAYGEAGKGVDTAVKETVAVLQTLLGFRTDDLQKQFLNLSNSVLASVTTYTTLGDAVGTMTEETSPKFAKFKGAIDDFRESAKKGEPDIRQFRIAIDEIKRTSSDENVKKLAQELFDLTKRANSLSLAIDGTAKAFRNLDPAVISAKEQADLFAKAMEKLGSTVTPNLDDRQKIMENYGKALEKAGSTESRLAAARVRDNQLSILAANEQKKAQEEAASAAETAEKRFQSALNAVAKRNAQMSGARPAISAGVGALENIYSESMR